MSYAIDINLKQQGLKIVFSSFPVPFQARKNM